MSATNADTRYRYAEAGTLPRPRWIGRTARVLFGLGALWVVGNVLAFGAGLVTRGHLAAFPGWWIVIAIGVAVFPDVVNIGWGWRVGRARLVAGLLGVAVSLGLGGLAAFGSFWAAPLGLFAYAWLLYTFSHLGLAFVVAAALATPGCEMRSLPELWARVRGRASPEHHCPGVISNIDRWEARVLGPEEPPGSSRI